MNFGRVIEERGVSLRTAAEAIGVTPMAISNIVAGKTDVSPDMAQLLGAYLIDAEHGNELLLNEIEHRKADV